MAYKQVFEELYQFQAVLMQWNCSIREKPQTKSTLKVPCSSRCKSQQSEDISHRHYGVFTKCSRQRSEVTEEDHLEDSSDVGFLNQQIPKWWWLDLIALRIG